MLQIKTLPRIQEKPLAEDIHKVAVKQVVAVALEVMVGDKEVGWGVVALAVLVVEMEGWVAEMAEGLHTVAPLIIQFR